MRAVLNPWHRAFLLCHGVSDHKASSLLDQEALCCFFEILQQASVREERVKRNSLPCLQACDMSCELVAPAKVTITNEHLIFLHCIRFL